MSGEPLQPVAAVILAAGRGERMRSRLPKVLHPVAGRPMLSWVMEAAREAGCGRILAVVGHGGERVREELEAPDVTWVEQREQLGTGHALAQTESLIREPGPLLVLSGDVPLVRAATLSALLEESARGWGAMAVAELEEPGSLGRVIAAADGSLEKIVEAADAEPDESALRLVNAGIYALPSPEIFGFLSALEPDNRQGELYLTEALRMAAEASRGVRLLHLADPTEAMGINDREDLIAVERVFLERKAAALLAAGVSVLDPRRTVVEPGVEVGADSRIEPGVCLTGATRIGEGCAIRQGAWIRDSILGEGVVVEPYSVLEGVEAGPGCRIGPFARLRPGTVLERGAKVGNFVEVKNSRLGPGVKANHLAYLGDAVIGEGSNVGAGSVTCNYDGRAKHRTEIGRRAFIGSDTMLVAPVKVGDEAATGAGSVITDDVPPGALGVARSRQRNLKGWAARRNRRKAKEE